MHYRDTNDIQRLTAAGDVLLLDPKSGQMRPMDPDNAMHEPKVVSLNDLEEYKLRRDIDHNIAHVYIFHHKDGHWRKHDTYGNSDEVLGLSARDFTRKPARESDRLAKAAAETEEHSELADMNLSTLLGSSRYRDEIINAIITQYPPVYDEDAKTNLARRFSELLPCLGRKPMRGQADSILASALSLEKHRGTNLVGEMGCGKTTISIMTAMLAGMALVLVVCPTHLTRKWYREITQTVPGAKAYIVEAIRPAAGKRSPDTRMDLETLRKTIEERKAKGTLDPRAPIYAVIPSTLASLSFSGEGTGFKRRIFRDISDTRAVRALDAGGNEITVEQPRLKRVMKTISYTDNYGRRIEYAEPTAAQACPDCFTPATDKSGTLFEESAPMWKKRTRCRRCGGALWSARRLSLDKSADESRLVGEEHAARARKPVSEWRDARADRWSGKTRYALGDYIARYMKGLFDLLIADEVHECAPRHAA